MPTLVRKSKKCRNLKIRKKASPSRFNFFFVHATFVHCRAMGKPDDDFSPDWRAAKGSAEGVSSPASSQVLPPLPCIRLSLVSNQLPIANIQDSPPRLFKTSTHSYLERRQRGHHHGRREGNVHELQTRCFVFELSNAHGSLCKTYHLMQEVWWTCA